MAPIKSHGHQLCVLTVVGSAPLVDYFQRLDFCQDKHSLYFTDCSVATNDKIGPEAYNALSNLCCTGTVLNLSRAIHACSFAMHCAWYLHAQDHEQAHRQSMVVVMSIAMSVIARS